ncbi:MAG: VOC family protein [Rhodospirillaceae bacterium]|nr:VOC family protein [Rhodospirillaceae bacterium]
MAILGIHHTALVVPDLQRALDFYCGVLGFETVQIGPMTPTRGTEENVQLERPEALGHIVRSGWGHLEIWEFKHPVHPEHQFFWTPVNEYGIRHISLMVENAMDTYKYLKEHMIFHAEPIVHSVEGPDNEAWTAYGRDPFGNVLELWQLGPKDPQPFAPKQYPHPASKQQGGAVAKHGILGIHHVAIVVPDLQRALDFYCGVLGFEKDQYGPIEPHPYTERITQLPNPSAEGYDVRSGWGYLEIWEFKHPVAPPPENWKYPVNRFGFTHISLMTDDCWGEYERLRGSVEFHRAPREHSVEGPDNHAVTNYGRDPFGNVLEFWQLGPRDPQPYPPAKLPHG